MKKVLSILLIILLIAGVFILTGCTQKVENQETKVEEVVVDETLVKINGLEFKVDQDKVFNNLNYKISGDFKEVTHEVPTPYVQYNHLTDDGNLLYFRIFYYEGKDLDAAVQDLGIENPIFEDDEINGIEYKVYKEPRDDGGMIHFYFINKDGNEYALHFVSKYDISSFEEKVLKSVKF